MPAFVCCTCGVQHADSAVPPARCAICEDERQYVPAEGQRWTTLDELAADHRAVVTEEEPGLTGIGVEPSFAIGQRALLVQTAHGNLLWDCVPYLDDTLVDAVEGLGGVDAIAVSHPHFYAAVVEWSRAFGDAPVHLHAADREWLVRGDRCVEHWDGERLEPIAGLRLVRCGGHFPGATVCHWQAGADGRGVLLAGDVVMVAADTRWVSFMWSYPNLVPLDAAAVRGVAAALAPLAFDRIYGGWWGKVVREDAKGAVVRSADRYLRAIGAA